MPAASFNASPTKKVGQEARRLRRKFTDPHGRLWSAEVDVKAEKPDACSPFEPVRFDEAGQCVGGWSAPWMPDQKYLKIDPKDDRLLAIDYQSALSDLEDARTRWDEDKARYILSYFPDDDQRAKAEADPPQVILGLCGPQPMHPNVIKAAMIGEPWVIGTPGAVMPHSLAGLIPKPPKSRVAALESDDFVRQLRAEMAAPAEAVDGQD